MFKFIHIFFLLVLVALTLAFLICSTDNLKCKRRAKGACCTGPTGPQASDSLSIENVTFSETGPTTLSSERDVSFITSYSYSPYNAGLLPDEPEGSSKYLALSNNAVAPVQIGTSAGTFLLSNPNSEVQMVFDEGAWKQINGKALTWFPTTQQGSKLVGTGAGTGSVTASIQGFSVSADGNTVAVGGLGDNDG